MIDDEFDMVSGRGLHRQYAVCVFLKKNETKRLRVVYVMEILGFLKVGMMVYCGRGLHCQ